MVDWIKYKGEGPWEFEKLLDGWMKFKGEGVWAFTEQQDKWGYLNNPRWQTSPQAPVSYTGNEEDEPQIWKLP